jgi:hypothetical protein
MKKATAGGVRIICIAKNSGKNRRGAGGRRCAPCRRAWNSGISSVAARSLMQRRSPMAKKNGRRDKTERFVALPHYVMNTFAWKQLTCTARAA